MMEVETWQHFSVPCHFTEKTVHLHVREPTYKDGILRARKDDNLWFRRDVRYHGYFQFDPNVSRVKSTRGFRAFLAA